MIEKIPFMKFHELVKYLDVKFVIQAGIPIMWFASIAQTMRNITTHLYMKKSNFQLRQK